MPMDAAVPGAQEQQKAENTAGASLGQDERASSVARLELFCAGLEAGQLGVWAWDIPSSRMTWSTNLEGWHGRPEKSLDGTFSFSAENLPRRTSRACWRRFNKPCGPASRVAWSTG